MSSVSWKIYCVFSIMMRKMYWLEPKPSWKRRPVIRKPWKRVKKSFKKEAFSSKHQFKSICWEKSGIFPLRIRISYTWRLKISLKRIFNNQKHNMSSKKNNIKPFFQVMLTNSMKQWDSFSRLSNKDKFIWNSA